MGRKILIGVAIVAVVLGLTVRCALPKRLQNVLPAQSATVENALNAQPAIPASSETFYPVTRVVDGDTIAVEMKGKVEKVRLIGLDTPETVDPRKPVQCFGKEASDKAKEILSGKRVRLEMDASQGARDKYGRLLAYTYVANDSFSGNLDADRGAEKAASEPYYDGTATKTQRLRNDDMRQISFNEYMIAEGYGHQYTYRLPYKYQKEFKEAEKTAREEKKGLWADGACGFSN